MSDLLAELIRNLESATAPSTELDDAIAVVFGKKPKSWRCDACGTFHGSFVQDYTRSLDSALTLMPNSPHLRPWDILSRGDRWEATVGAGFHSRDIGYEHHGESRATPAIALCIALIKAIVS